MYYGTKIRYQLIYTQQKSGKLIEFSAFCYFKYVFYISSPVIDIALTSICSVSLTLLEITVVVSDWNV